MFSIKTWMLGAAVLAGGVALGVPTANAVEIGVYIGAPIAYVPPCPGPGYFWVDGYYSGPYWVPGRWEFRGDFDRDRYWDRERYERFYRDHDWDRDRHGDRDWDHDRGWHRGWDHDGGRDHDRSWDHDRDHFRR